MIERMIEAVPPNLAHAFLNPKILRGNSLELVQDPRELISNPREFSRCAFNSFHFREDTKTLETLPVSNCAKLCKSGLVAVNLAASI